MSEGLLNVVEKLEVLVAFVPRDSRELRDWYARAQDLQDKIKSSPALSNAVPESVWHYLADADTRMRDADYADAQQREIRSKLETLRHPRVNS